MQNTETAIYYGPPVILFEFSDSVTRDAPVTVHRSPVHRTTDDTGGTVAPGYGAPGGTVGTVALGYGGTGSTVTPVYIVGWYGGYGVLPPLHSYKSGMQRDDGTPYPPYYPAMYTGATVPRCHRTPRCTGPPGAPYPRCHRTTGVTGGR
jgi:hypothetical protein